MRKGTADRSLLLAVALWSLVLVIGGCGQQAQSPSPAAGNGAAKTVSGKVTVFTSGDPLAGVLVYAGGKTAMTDSSGNYLLEGVPISAESITVQCGSYTPITVYSTKESVDVELSLFPSEQNTPLGYMSPNSTISGEVRDEDGVLVPGSSVFLHHRYHYGNGYASNGQFAIRAYLDPAKFPLQAFLSAAKSSGAGIREIEINNTGSINAGTLEVSSSPGIVSGEVAIPFTPSSHPQGYVSWGISDGAGRFFSSGWGHSSIYSGKYTLYLPATPSGYKYYLRAFAYGADYEFSSAQYIENIEIASGEAKKVDFSIPAGITIEAPADGTVSVGTEPLIRWTSPDPKFNLFFVIMHEGGGSSLFKWIGVTDQTSITYPTFSSGSGFEHLNLDPAKGYVLQIVGYYIPGFNLSASKVKVADVAALFSPGPKVFSAEGRARALTMIEINQALEQTMSRKSYFSTSSVPHVAATSATGARRRSCIKK